MPLADGNSIAPGAATLLTDDQKNQDAADQLKAASVRAINQALRCINTANAAITNAPGNKAAVLAKIGGTGSGTDGEEVQQIMDALVALHNAHKKTGASNISF